MKNPDEGPRKSPRQEADRCEHDYSSYNGGYRCNLCDDRLHEPEYQDYIHNKVDQLKQQLVEARVDKLLTQKTLEQRLVDMTFWRQELRDEVAKLRAELNDTCPNCGFTCPLSPRERGRLERENAELKAELTKYKWD